MTTQQNPDLIPPASEPNWLTDEEQQSWRGLLLVYQMLFEGLDKQLRTEAGIPHTYYTILAMLSEAPERRLRMSDLAKVTSASQSRTSHAVAALEQRGWVTRESCPTDKRGQFAALTEAGFEAVVELAPKHVAEVRRLIFDHLTPAEVRQLTSITTSINHRDPGR